MMMTAVLKKPRAATTARRKPAAKAVQVVSVVDVLIARLKKLRKGQTGSFDLREAIEAGRD